MKLRFTLLEIMFSGLFLPLGKTTSVWASGVCMVKVTIADLAVVVVPKWI